MTKQLLLYIECTIILWEAEIACEVEAILSACTINCVEEEKEEDEEGGGRREGRGGERNGGGGG